MFSLGMVLWEVSGCQFLGSLSPTFSKYFKRFMRIYAGQGIDLKGNGIPLLGTRGPTPVDRPDSLPLLKI